MEKKICEIKKGKKEKKTRWGPAGIEPTTPQTQTENHSIRPQTLIAWMKYCSAFYNIVNWIHKSFLDSQLFSFFSVFSSKFLFWIDKVVVQMFFKIIKNKILIHLHKNTIKNIKAYACKNYKLQKTSWWINIKWCKMKLKSKFTKMKKWNNLLFCWHITAHINKLA